MLMIMLFACGRLPFEALTCSTDEWCEAVWPEFAPACNAGVCSQCDADHPCETGTCVEGDDHFWTCVP